MVLSLQAIDFLLASSIQVGCLLSDGSTDGRVGSEDGDEGDSTFFLAHLSSRGFSGTLMGLDSKEIHKRTNKYPTLKFLR